MITDAADIKVITNLKGKKIDLSFDENSLAHIMSVLTDLYSDPELAVIREYSTNAWDAHVEAGTDRPIEVSLPTTLSPHLKIRDYGVGLSLADIEEIYSKYGASTKRQTNDMVGMLGLGCKSGLTYASQFTLVSVKDGMLTKAIVSRDESGAGGINIVEHSTTDESNGTEIIIPAARYNNFEAKAYDFFEFWPSGRVLINGKPNEQIRGEWVIKDRMLIAPKNYTEKTNDTIVMGGVPYPFDSGIRLSNNQRIIAYVDIGEVNFTPSRESLQMTSKTKATIEKVISDFYSQVAQTVQREINTAKTRIEALEMQERWYKIYPQLKQRETFEWNGEVIPEFVVFADDAQITTASSYRKAAIDSVGPNFHLSSGLLKNTLLVYDYDLANFTAPIKNKLNYWAMTSIGRNPNNWGFSYPYNNYILVKEKPTNCPWLGSMKMISYEKDIKPIKLQATSRKKIIGSFKGSVKGEKYEKEIDIDSLDPKTIIYYYRFRGEYNDYYQGIVEITKGDYVVLFVPDNRRKKFLRDCPKAKWVGDAAKEILDDFVANLTQDEKKAISLQSRINHGKSLTILDESKILDPTLKEHVRLAKIDVQKARVGIERAQRFGLKVDLPAISPRIHAYPLYDSYKMSHYENHIYDYLNTMYKKGV